MSATKLDEDGLHVVMFPFFAFGHITPFVHLSNNLASHGFKITFLTTAGNVPRLKPLFTPNPAIQILTVALPPVAGLPPAVETTADASPRDGKLIGIALDLTQPQIETLISQLKPHFIIFDFAQHWLPPLAARLGIKAIYFTVFTASATAYYASYDGRVSTPPTVETIKNPPGLPGLTARRTFESLYISNLFKNFHETGLNRMLKTINGCDAIVMKSSREMEPAYIDYVESRFKKPVLLAGPLVPEPQSGELEDRWAQWLDQFEDGSVVFCSFGSETFLTDDQIRELALGLELAGKPFFLVLNFPASLEKSSELNRTLPEGFVERVKHKGIVHSGWVQQWHILAHRSVGCFLCHAGYN